MKRDYRESITLANEILLKAERERKELVEKEAQEYLSISEKLEIATKCLTKIAEYQYGMSRKAKGTAPQHEIDHICTLARYALNKLEES